MITIYKRDGSTEKVDAPLIEVASTDGKPCLFILKHDDGGIEILQGKDKTFQALCTRLGKEPAKIYEQPI